MKSDYLNSLYSALEAAGADYNKIREVVDEYERMYDLGIEAGIDEEELERRMGNPKDIAKRLINGDIDHSIEYFEVPNSLLKKLSFKGSIDTISLRNYNNEKICVEIDNDIFNKYEIQSKPEGLFIKEHQIILNKRSQAGKIVVSLPYQINIGDISINNVSGEIFLSSVSCQADININSVSGLINCDGVNAKTVSLKSVSGKIACNGITCESVSLSSVSGANKLDNFYGTNARISTVSGNIFVGKTSCNVHTTSVSGKIEVNGESKDNSIKFFNKKFNDFKNKFF